MPSTPAIHHQAQRRRSAGAAGLPPSSPKRRSSILLKAGVEKRKKKSNNVSISHIIGNSNTKTDNKKQRQDEESPLTQSTVFSESESLALGSLAVPPLHARDKNANAPKSQTTAPFQNIQVAIRLRPLSADERQQPAPQSASHRPGLRSSLRAVRQHAPFSHNHASASTSPQGNGSAWIREENSASNGESVLVQRNAPRRQGKTVFCFDRIFDQVDSTQDVYQAVGAPLVSAVMSGRHATLFAYGQTGAGKTFTMLGDCDDFKDQGGMIGMMAQDLLSQLEPEASSCKIKASYLEIYEERVRDLLGGSVSSIGKIAGSPSSTSTTPRKNNRQNKEQAVVDLPIVTLREDPNDGVHFACVERHIENIQQIQQVLQRGSQSRVVASTDRNQRSSRSHAIFRLTVERSLKRKRVVSVLNMVDLAGSESGNQNVNEKRQREGSKINQSLFSLSQVIHALSLPQKKRPRHINYRDSKLTRILQPHLSGNAALAVLCCATPSWNSVEETRSTLRFATRAKLVQTKPQVNEFADPNDESSVKIRKLQNQVLADRSVIATLQRELTQAQEALRKVKSTNKNAQADLLPSSDNACAPPCAAEQLNEPSKELSRTEDSEDDTTLTSVETDRNAIRKRLTNAWTEVANNDEPREEGSSLAPGAVSLGSSGGHEEDWDSVVPREVMVITATPENNSHSSCSAAVAFEGHTLDSKIQDSTVTDDDDTNSLRLQLFDAEEHIEFLGSKLRSTTDVVERLFHDLEKAKKCIHDLVKQNLILNDELQERDKEIAELQHRGHASSQSLDIGDLSQHHLATLNVSSPRRGEDDIDLIENVTSSVPSSESAAFIRFGMYVGLVILLLGKQELFLVASLFLYWVVEREFR